MIIDGLIATSIDGYISKNNNSTVFKSLSSNELLEWRKKFRCTYDAILVGMNTIYSDNPSLLNDSKNNFRIIIDTKGNININYRVFLEKPENTIVLTNIKADPSYEILNKLGVKILYYRKLNREILINLLYQFQISKILVEGGANTINMFLKHKIIDSLNIVTFPLFIKKGKRLSLDIDIPENNYHLKFIDKKYSLFIIKNLI
jgi:diaminohydroxyphosphoribosylaminopyrimidine deaminase/5-amino-6-(5-phosphoribosylamino)uracil reductase